MLNFLFNYLPKNNKTSKYKICGGSERCRPKENVNSLAPPSFELDKEKKVNQLYIEIYAHNWPSHSYHMLKEMNQPDLFAKIKKHVATLPKQLRIRYDLKNFELLTLEQINKAKETFLLMQEFIQKIYQEQNIYPKKGDKYFQKLEHSTQIIITRLNKAQQILTITLDTTSKIIPPSPP